MAREWLSRRRADGLGLLEDLPNDLLMSMLRRDHTKTLTMRTTGFVLSRDRRRAAASATIQPPVGSNLRSRICRES
jgi:hypothetical protein